jgi:lipopolysaccharide transport system ATP-binding protein
MKPILEINNISKKYRIQHEKQSYLSMRDAIGNIFKSRNNSTEEFYALKDISFNVMPGESIGIIGKNGAGKSTLLKILSKITPPSSGKITSRGRIASLLEVGTGFHGELSGRENIYLNGSILGMKKAEIQNKFDAIVDFSGVDKFLDTPLKHYSSGMQLRLAFAVAAFLEPEILIIDEVLAVGDAEFQKKCLGKMDEVTKQGRTVLFVSHNMNVLSTLTKTSILLANGQLKMIGKTSNVIYTYLDKKGKESENFTTKNPDSPKIAKLELKSTETAIHHFSDPLSIIVQLEIPVKIDTLELSFQICNSDTTEPIVYNWFSTAEILESLKNKTGKFEIEINIPSLRLYKGEYYFKFYLSDPRGKIIHQQIEQCLPFEVLMHGINNEWGWNDNTCKYIENCQVIIKPE